MEKATLTLSIDKKLKKELSEIKGVNWSEETRQFLEQRVKRLKLLKKFDELTKNSELTEQEVLEIGRKINSAVAQKHGL